MSSEFKIREGSVLKTLFADSNSSSRRPSQQIPSVLVHTDNPLVKKIVYYLPAKPAERKTDFTSGVACILQGAGDNLESQDGKRKLFECSEAAQVNAGFVYEKFEELISKFIQIKYTGEEDRFGEENELTVLIPHCLSRTSALYREPVVKARINSNWIHLPTEEVVLDEFKDVRFVQARLRNDLPSHLCVTSQFKTDSLRFSRQSSRCSSTVDQRFALKVESGTFTSRKTFPLQLLPIDSNAVNRLTAATANGRCVLCSSNIVSIAWGGEKILKPVLVNLPIPANPVKMKKIAKAEQAAKENTNSEKKRKMEVKSDEKANKWYMGIYGDDENDVLYLFYFDQMSESWAYLPDITLTEIRKDLVSFYMPKPLYKFVVLRCRTELSVIEARKLVHMLEDQLTIRAVRFILFQTPREHAEVTVHCISAQKFGGLYEELYQEGWKFHGSNGPPTSKEVMLREGAMFDIGFRGNIKFDERFCPPGKRLTKYWNSQLPCRVSFTITEADKHLQRSYDFFKGLCIIQSVERGFVSDGVMAGSMKSSSASLTTSAKRTTSSVAQEKKRTLCELLVQLAKGIETGAQTPPAGKLCIQLDPMHEEAIQILSSKLGKEWEVLAKSLGLTPGRIEAIKTRNKQTPDKIKEDMLYSWIKRQPKASDRLPKLYYSLMNCGRIDLAYKMEDLYQDHEDQLDLVPEEGVEALQHGSFNVTALGDQAVEGSRSTDPIAKTQDNEITSTAA